MEILILSTALGMDLFSVAVPIGMNRIKRSVILKASVVFAFFHIVMLLSGYYIGRLISGIVDQLGAQSGSSVLMIEDCASIAGAGVLIGLGALMMKEGIGQMKGACCQKRGDLLSGWALLVLAFSVSVDAMAAGFSFGMMEVNLVELNIILGGVIFIIAIIGLSVGRQVGHFFGERSAMLGGGVLILMGTHILWRFLS